MSGTGPKAGGPHYLPRLQRRAEPPSAAAPGGPVVDIAAAFGALPDAAAWAAREDRVAALRAIVGDHPALDAAAALPLGPVDLPGPTGESNRLSLHPRGRVLALGVGAEAALAQALQALALGNAVLAVAEDVEAALAPLAGRGLPVAARDGQPDPAALAALPGLALVAARGPEDWLRSLRRALAARSGPVTPLETGTLDPARYALERHLCIDTTAAGGNASLLAASA